MARYPRGDRGRGIRTQVQARVRRKRCCRNAAAGVAGAARCARSGMEDDKVTLRDAEAEVVREMVDRYLAGASIRSLTHVAQRFSAGIAPAVAKSWQTSAVRQILTLGPHRRAARAPRGGDRPGCDGPAMVAPAAAGPRAWPGWPRALSTEGPRRRGRTCLSGMLRCGRCGNRLFSPDAAAREKNAENRVRRYVCLKGPDHGGCGRLTVVAEPVEHLLTEAV